MEDLRILAENIDQKNEIISMLVSIGYNGESTCSYDDDDLMGIHVYEDGDIQDVLMGDYYDKDHKEITIQQLRDMVVLKRNDVNDRTHIDSTGCDYYKDSNGDFYYKTTRNWKITREIPECIKPIGKKK